MNLYAQSYLTVLKKDFMLVIIAAALLFFTFFLWAGVPVFIIGSFVSTFTSNLVINHLSMSVSTAFLFSLYFVPLNLKVAKHIANRKNRSFMYAFIRVEMIWIAVCSLIFEMIILIHLRL